MRSTVIEDFNEENYEKRTLRNRSWGNSIQLAKEVSDIRIFYQNVNGLRQAQNFGETAILAQQMGEREVDVICLAETNVEWKHRNSKKIRRHFDIDKRSIKMVTATTKEQFEKVYKPGGVAQITRGDLTGRIFEMTSDKEELGRYVIQRFQGRRQTKLSIITAYRVPKVSNYSSGPNTAHSQQVSEMRCWQNPSDDPRKQTLIDLKNVINNLKSMGDEIVLCIDANEFVGDRRGEFQKFVNETNLVDLHVSKHGTDGEPATHIRGSKRIDYMLGTEEVARYVSKAGILAFGEVGNSDHRGMFVDIDVTGLLRGSIEYIVRRADRGITSGNPKTATKYMTAVLKYMEDHQVEERISTLSKRTKDGTMDWAEISTELDKIDKDLTRALLHGETTCRKKDGVSFSTTLMKARKLVTFSKMWLSEVRTGRDLSEQRRNILQEFNDEERWSLLDLPRPSETEAKAMLKKHQQLCREVVNEAQQWREAELKEKIKALSEATKINEESILKRILASEQERKEFNHMRVVLGKMNGEGLSSIIAPSEDPSTCVETLKQQNIDTSEWKSIFDADKIEKVIMARNQHHFSQAKGTPFTVPPLSEVLGWDGISEFTEQLWSDKKVLEKLEIDDHAKKILQKISERRLPVSTTPDITTDEMRGKFKAWKEGTSTSPSGRHLSHYITLSKHRNDEEEECDADRIMKSIAMILNMAFECEVVLDRWRDITNVMIEKIPGTPTLNKLRVIYLFEADFNLALGIYYGRRLMREAEQEEMLDDQQYGSRKGRSCEDVLLLKLATYMYFDLTKTNGGTFDNDARACYDRMPPNLWNILATRLGMDKRICKVHAELLKSARYRVQTKIGLSEGTYSCTEEMPLFGPGQGGTASAFIWGIISSIILSIMKEEKRGVTMKNPTGEALLKRVMDAFVDDTTAWLNNIRNLGKDVTDSIDELIQELQDTVQMWEQLLHATGGALELSKCFYYIIHWDWKDGIARLSTPEQIKTRIKIKDSETGKVEEIKMKSCYESHRTLGIMQNAAGDFKSEFNRIQTKSNDLARKTATARLTIREVTKLHRNYYGPSISYGMVGSALTKSQYEAIEKPMIPIIMNGLGYNKNMPKAVTFGPEEMGGIGLISMYVHQGTTKTMRMIQHMRSESKVGKALRIALDWTQLKAGTSFNILEETKIDIPKIEGGEWFEKLREFLRESNCGLYIKNVYKVVPRRQGDTPIMEEVMKYEFSKSEIEDINRIRTHLRVECISDICNAQGDKVSTAAFKVNRDELPSSSLILWPTQPKPKRKTAWTNFLRLLTQGGKDNRRLRRSLGSWYLNHDKCRQWRTVYSTTSGYISELNDKQRWIHYLQHVDARSHTVVLNRTNFSDDNEIPTDTVPVDIVGQRVHMPEWVRKTETRTTAANMQEHLQKVDKWKRKLLQNARAEGDESELQEISKHDTILVCSDGGQIDKAGAFGWVVGTEDRMLWKGRGKVGGKHMSSFRAEGHGCLAAMSFLQEYDQLYKMPWRDCKIVFYCDNKGLLNRLDQFKYQQFWGISKYSEPEMDCVSEINSIRSKLGKFGVEFTQEHVRGHQDRTKNWENLSREAQLNVTADQLATEELDDTAVYSVHGESLKIDSCNCYLLHQGEIITSKEEVTLRRVIVEEQMRCYLIERNEWDDMTYDKIDWEAFSAARKRSPSYQKRFVSKFVHGWLPTATRLCRQNQRTNNNCPLCNEPETNTHIFTCTKRVAWKRLFGGRLGAKLKALNTDPTIKRSIEELFKDFLHTYELDEQSKRQHPAYMILRGYIYSSTTHQQQKYLDKIGERLEGTKNQFDTGKTWTRQLVEFMWEEAQSLWKNRNEQIHVKEHTISELSTVVSLMYRESQEILATDRRLIFRMEKEVLVSKGIVYVKEWLRRFGKLFEHSKKQARLIAVANVRRLEKYFPRVDQQNRRGD